MTLSLSMNARQSFGRLLAMELSARIRLAREHAKLTQEELASRMGVKRQAVTNWELGGGIKRANLEKLANVTGVSYGWLSMESDRPPQLSPEAPAHSDAESGRKNATDTSDRAEPDRALLGELAEWAIGTALFQMKEEAPLEKIQAWAEASVQSFLVRRSLQHLREKAPV